MHHIGIIKTWLAFLAIHIACLSSRSQVPGLINYTEKDGLKSSMIYRISQDNDGFIWFGTNNGAFRFDGKEFRHFNEKDGLKNLDVLEVVPMEKDELFLSSFLTNFARIHQGKIINNDPKLQKIRLHSNLYTNYDKQRKELVAVSMEYPTVLYQYRNGKVTKTITDIFGGLVLGYENGLLYYAGTRGRIFYYDVQARRSVTCDFRLPKNQYPVGLSENFLLVDKGQKLDIYFRQTPVHFRFINSIPVDGDVFTWRIDHKKRLWLALKNEGILCFPQSLSPPFSTQPPVQFLTGHLVGDMYVDRDDNLWISTRNDGLFFIGRQFLSSSISNTLNSYSGFVNVLAGNANTLIWGSNRGNVVWQKKDAIIDRMPSTQRSEIKAIHVTGNELLIINDFSIYRYNLVTGRARFGDRTVLTGSLKNIAPYDSTRVLLCSGVACFLYDHQRDHYEEIFQKRCYSACAYDREQVFVGTENGLYLVNTFRKTAKPVIDSGYIIDIKRLDKDRFLAATLSNGVFVFNRSGILQTFTDADGLLSNNIKKIQVENSTVFWACTNSGISRVIVGDRKVSVQNFTRIDGLPSEKVNDCFIRGDTIYIGTSRGMGVYTIPELLSQKIKVLDKQVIIANITTKNKEWYRPSGPFVLGPGDNTISFHLSFLDYISLGNVRYSYRLEGLDDTWKTTAASDISFNSLSPGNYIFSVRGMGYSGLESIQTTSFSFTIQPYFWQTTWFRLLSVFLIVLLSVFIIRFFEKRSRQKKMQSLVYEKRVAELELQAIKAQINPHFIYNCLNSIQFLLYKKDYEKADSYLDVFSQMIRKTLHYSEKTFITIEEETDYLRFYLDMEALRSHNSFTYTIAMSENVLPSWQIPSLLIQPFVENAVKHGVAALKDREGHISVSFDFREPFLLVQITDNGPGIARKTAPAIPSGSFGMKLSAKRMETFRQLFASHITMDIESPADGSSGTIVQLTLIPV